MRSSSELLLLVLAGVIAVVVVRYVGTRTAMSNVAYATPTPTGTVQPTPTPAPPTEAAPTGAASATHAPGATAEPIATGSTTKQMLYSATLGKPINYIVYLPGGYAHTTERYPVIYLLHGRGDSMASWEPITSLVDDMIKAGEMPPAILILPDAPSSKRAGYYVDSLFGGNDSLPPGEKVETAFTKDLIAHVDATYRTVANRNGRAVAGYSMGGYGALRYLLAHPDLFRAGIALSPAVYYPLPPAGSSTREFGAFGNGSVLFDESVYTQKNYPALFPAFEAANLPSALFIAVGDDESANPNPADAVHDLDYEAHTLYNKARRVKNLLVELRVLDGGHDWQVWRPGFIEGLHYIFKFITAQDK